MRIRVGRIIVFALLAEFLAVLALVLIVAVFGPADPDAAAAYAQQLGNWVGPIGGFVFTLLAAWWVARRLTDAQLLHGFLVGVAVAAIDVAILVLSAAEFQWLFVASNVGRIVAGTLGGWLAPSAANAQTAGGAGSGQRS